MENRNRILSGAAWAVWSLLTLVQIVLAFVLYNQDSAISAALRAVGWVVWVLSCVFGWWPMVELRRKGSVAKGRSYTRTTVLVDSRLYSVVRHPQYLSFMLVNLALPMIVQHWLVAALGVAGAVLVYTGILPAADRRNVERFGEAYREYMERVPRVNVVAGIVRLIRRRGQG
jgi:protein-S-isoprenylcysteine O-methyltransferase Ste14